MDNQWQPYNLETFPGGVSSAVSPDLLPTNQIAWGMNADFRGSKIHTRPNIAQRMFLPPGLVQGLGYFNLQSGMIIVVIAGVPYRIRVGPRTENFSVEQIILPWYNSPLIKQVWMCQTVESFLIQDGQSAAIIYDGTTARRANRLIPEVPIGLQMAYGNGRLWVAIEGNQLVAGDIRTDTPGSELSFTETQYLSGGGALSFGTPITALAFLPVIGTSDYGALAAMGRNYVETVRADITSRDSWASYPGFVTNALRNVGTPSGWTAVPVNQDIFFRDALGGLRSLNSGLSAAYYAQYRGAQGDSNISISREVSRLVDFDSQQLLGFSSGVYFNNRLLVTSSPFLNKQGGVSHKDLVCLDFAPVATMQGQTPPAYNGTWQGVNWTKLVSGEFNTQTRAFGVSSDEDGYNRLWEFDSGDIVDLYLSGISDGSAISNGTALDSPIESFVEYPRVDFQDPKRRKRLTRCDVWLSNIAEEVEVKLYWKPDNNQKWTFWDSTAHCAMMTDPAVSGPHIWKNLLPEQRPLIKSFSIPDEIDGLSTYDLSTGFGFQIRLVWIGKLQIERVVLWATAVDSTDYAIREGQDPACKANDVSGNEIRYEIPLSVKFSESALMLSRQRGGVAQLVGFSGPTQGKKFLRIDGSGRLDRCNFDPPDCMSITGGDSYVLSGYSLYDVSTSSISEHGSFIVYRDSGICPAVTVSSASGLSVAQPLSQFQSAPNGVGHTYTNGLNFEQTTGTGDCYYPTEVGRSGIFTNFFRLDYSSEYTEADAIAVVQAANPWPGSFSVCTTPVSCCRAAYQQRSTGFTFEYAEAQAGIQVVGLSPDTTYTITLDVYRRVYGMGEYSLFGVLSFPATTDVTGALNAIKDVPNTEGYETYVSNPIITR